MATLKKLTSLFRSLSSNPAAILARKPVIANKKLIANLNREQLLEGQKANGNSMPVYTARSIAMKRGAVSPSGTFTLKETGDFHNSIKIDVDANGMVFNSDQKVILGIIKKETGKDPSPALGLNAEYRSEMIKLLRPKILKTFKNKLK